MRGLNCRRVRLDLMVKVAIAMAALFPLTAAMSAQSTTTATLTPAATNNPNACTQGFVVDIAGTGSVPTGAVVINDLFNSQNMTLGTEALDATGKVDVSFALATGTHTLTAVYPGNGSFLGSTSASVSISVTAVCNLTVGVSMSAASVKAGEPVDGTVTLTPLNNGGTTVPTFVTLSCSGLPVNSSCSFNPENVEIPGGSNAAITSGFTLQTVAQAGPVKASKQRTVANGITWALLLPGVLALGCLRRSRSRMGQWGVLLLMGLVVSLGTSGCGARYAYLNHGPPKTPPTPAGTYTFMVTAQTSNGVTATEENTRLTLTVN